ncbi:MAG: hypothetical protein K2G23_00820, partial [Muribaculaceae bacterium]|nr:hypothetical protein [Muribaculaceae bacterium]
MNDLLLELADIDSVKEISDRYRALSAFFHRFLNRATADARPAVEFRGPFAKTDYLLKENGADRHLSHIVNEARVRFRQLPSLKTLSPEELEKPYRLDFEAVARFVALIENCEIPQQISDRFPEQRKTQTRGELAAEYLRFIVENFDDQYIYVACEQFPDTNLKIDYITPPAAYPYDNSYL